MNQTVPPVSLTQPTQVGSVAAHTLSRSAFFIIIISESWILSPSSGSAKSRSDQLSGRGDSGERWDEDPGVGTRLVSDARSTGPGSSTNSGEGDIFYNILHVCASNRR